MPGIRTVIPRNLFAANALRQGPVMSVPMILLHLSTQISGSGHFKVLIDHPRHGPSAGGTVLGPWTELQGTQRAYGRLEPIL